MWNKKLQVSKKRFFPKKLASNCPFVCLLACLLLNWTAVVVVVCLIYLVSLFVCCCCVCVRAGKKHQISLWFFQKSNKKNCQKKWSKCHKKPLFAPILKWLSVTITKKLASNCPFAYLQGCIKKNGQQLSLSLCFAYLRCCCRCCCSFVLFVCLLLLCVCVCARGKKTPNFIVILPKIK